MTASLQPESKAPSRRALLAGALGGLGALAAAAIGRAGPARAANGDPVILGANHTATLPTKIENQGNAETVVWGASNSGIGVRGSSSLNVGVSGSSTSEVGVSGSSGSDIGVYGSSSSSIGVRGDSGSSFGVYAFSDATNQPASQGWSQGNSTGVRGFSGEAPLPSAKARTGVVGYAAQSSTSTGVWGESTSGVGLYGVATSGYAIRGSGRVKLGKVSGVATITAGHTTKVITPGVNVTSSSFVLLTPKVKLSGRDLWFTTDAANNKFTIRMSSSRSSATAVAWLLLG
jgi:hypothetical protein